MLLTRQRPPPFGMIHQLHYILSSQAVRWPPCLIRKEHLHPLPIITEDTHVHWLRNGSHKENSTTACFDLQHLNNHFNYWGQLHQLRQTCRDNKVTWGQECNHTLDSTLALHWRKETSRKLLFVHESSTPMGYKYLHSFTRQEG